ncbi:hypothetical protein DSO57_1031613 [Entomophthora muscae]|uniref:Uncharacterized protein n=1 Tax=Entomophthora muscae TaxID=34485 RepID=A0ACC2TYI5_9FUNG|nr:hypothetical protein DSO57_1031613 [Entomophthora muscae]
MSWVANLKRRVSLSIYRSSSEPPVSPELNAPLISLPESFTLSDEPKSPTLINLEALFRILASPLKKEDSIKVLKEAVLAFNESVIDARMSPKACTELLDGLECLPEFFFTVASYLSEQIRIFEEKNKIPEDIAFLSLAFLVFRYLIQYQSYLVKSLTHTTLPQTLLEFNRFFLSNDSSKQDLIGSDKAQNEADIFSLHQNNTLTLELLLLDNHFVKDIVLKGFAFDFFSTFLAFPEERYALLYIQPFNVVAVLNWLAVSSEMPLIDLTVCYLSSRLKASWGFAVKSLIFSFPKAARSRGD